MSSEAAEKGAFDKLLSANGIAWQDGQSQLAQPGSFQWLAGEAKQAAKTEDKKEPAAADQVELVFVEATPAQVTATLAGLSAQPEAFSSVSIKPEQDEAAGGTNWPAVVRQQVRNYGGQRKPVAAGPKQAPLARSSARTQTESVKAEGMEENLKPLNLSSMAVQSRAQRIQLLDSGLKGKEQSQLGVVVQESEREAPAENQSQPVAGSSGARRQSPPSDRAQIDSLAGRSPQQQVLFVLRVVGGDQSVSKAAKRQAGAPSDAAKPAEPATTPALEPADKK
jgi:hypothetical protein